MTNGRIYWVKVRSARNMLVTKRGEERNNTVLSTIVPFNTSSYSSGEQISQKSFDIISQIANSNSDTSKIKNGFKNFPIKDLMKIFKGFKNTSIRN